MRRTLVIAAVFSIMFLAGMPYSVAADKGKQMESFPANIKKTWSYSHFPFYQVNLARR